MHSLVQTSQWLMLVKGAFQLKICQNKNIHFFVKLMQMKRANAQLKYIPRKSIHTDFFVLS